MKNLTLTIALISIISISLHAQESNVKIFGKIWWESSATVSEAFNIIIPNKNIGDAFYGALGITKKGSPHKEVLIVRNESFIGLGTGGFYEYTHTYSNWTFTGRLQSLYFWNKPQVSWGKFQGDISYSLTKKILLSFKASDRYTKNDKNIFVVGLESKVKLWEKSSLSSGYIFRSVEKNNGHILSISFSQNWKNVFFTGTYQCQGDKDFSTTENLFSITIGMKLQ